ncbi:uncharacterized protein FIESC28_11163 [Fusarium coffeatum]|uniref:DUF6546 domain-containing protein n=1 Tax=Fusarium coffeatum TaxID=231269 RepID=A0A366QPF4_9HYPO|nr:uncharacterized protein FIESC28_11163 [Fusarium coffeatum]RBR06148.1 hypothetical protein FIESC28_11163 [Fusarium coffeatum]
MPVTTRSANRMSRPKIPYDIQLCVLDWLIALGKADSSVDVSPCATVCKTWQVVIERELFRHLTLTLKDLELFSKYCRGRKHYVKHILLEIWLCHRVGNDMDTVCFTEATETLFLELSTWEGHGITLEFGIVPSSARGQRFYPGRSKGFYIRYGPPPRKRSLDGHLRNPDRLELFDTYGEPSPAIHVSELRMPRPLDILGPAHLTFHDDSKVGTSLLAKVDCVSKLLIRRRYMPKISIQSLSTIVKSLPSLESLQLERWCYGHHPLYHHDRASDFDGMGLALPESLKELIYYKECADNYEHRGGEELHRLDPLFISPLTKVADRIEHIAISFSGSKLLNPNANYEFTALKTLAITSDTTVAKRMPKLETFEIWCFKNQRPLEARVFTYERLGEYSSCITLKDNWGPLKLSGRVQNAWKQVVNEGNGTFEVKHEFLTFGETQGV